MARFVVIRVLAPRGAGVVPPLVRSLRMATTMTLDVVPFARLLMAQAMGKIFVRSDVRHCMTSLDANIRFVKASLLHRRPLPSATAASLEHAIRPSMLIDMTLLACIRTPTLFVAGAESLVVNVGGRNITAFAVALVVPVMPQ